MMGRMELDVTTMIGAVRREVTTRDEGGRPARVVTATRTYAASPDEVWAAITDPDRIPRWFLPVSGDLRLGGRYQLEGQAGGDITACEPPRHLAVTWEYGGEVGWVDVRLEPDPAGTRLRLEHAAHVGGDRWDEYGPGAVGVGWDLVLVGLHEYQATGTVDRQAWETEEPARAFMRASSEAWGEASMAAGTPEEAARAAAGRTTAAYAGV